MSSFEDFAEERPDQTTVQGSDRLMMLDENGVFKLVTVEAIINYAGGPILGGYDLRVDEITWSPASPAANDDVIFTARIRNYGDSSMPAGTVANDEQLDVTVYIDGEVVAWSDQYEGALASGAFVDMEMNGGPVDVNYWVATAGASTVLAHVNNRQPNVRKPDETDFTNNTRSEVINVTGSGGPAPSTVAPVWIWGARGGDMYVGTAPSAAALQTYGIGGVVLTGQGAWVNDDAAFYADVFDYISGSGLDMSVGMYVGATPAPVDTSSVNTLLANLDIILDLAVAHGATSSNFDAEPYVYGGQLWIDISQALATSYGQQVGQALLDHGLDTAQFYCSSDASWSTSYNAKLQEEVNFSNPYTNSKFRYFLDGICDKGIEVTHTDAVFHHGPQRPGFTWETGAEDTVARAEAFHANLRGSIMFWSDNNEGAYASDIGYYAGTTYTATVAARNHSTGPIFVYHHNLWTPGYSAANLPWLGASGYLQEVEDGILATA